MQSGVAARMLRLHSGEFQLMAVPRLGCISSHVEEGKAWQAQMKDFCKSTCDLVF